MKKNVFKLPKAVTIMARSSSISNSFVNGIVPVIKPSEEEIETALKILEQNENDVRCVYCGDKKTEWDHLYPLIENKKHTGYITEIANLVPACNKCNQSKGNKNWKVWMTSDATLSPKSRNIPDLDKKIKLIEKYDKAFEKKQVNLEEIVGSDLWEKYQQAYEKLLQTMQETKDIYRKIKVKINGSKNKNHSSKVYKQECAEIEDINHNIVFKINDSVVSQQEFKQELLIAKEAERNWYFSDGTIETGDYWHVNRFSEKSNLFGNITTSKKYISRKEILKKLEIIIHKV